MARTHAPVSTPRMATMVALMALIGASASAAHAQEVVQYREPQLIYAQDFTQLRSLRVLSTGAVIAVEGNGGEVLFLEPDGQTVRPVGRRGGGPGEYQDPVGVVPIAGSDLSLLVDFAMRLLVLDPSGRVLVTEPWRLPIGAMPAARDANEGMFYDGLGTMRFDGAGRPMDGPAPLVRFHPREGSDTLTMLNRYDLLARWQANPVSRMFGGGPNGAANFRLDRSPFGAQDQWAFLPDGRVVVARVRPYRLEVITPGGQTVTGPEIAFDPIPVTAGDRESYVAGLGRGVSGEGGSFTNASGQSVALQRPQVDPATLPFPETKPAFPYGGVHVRGGGREIWVQRHTPSRDNRTLIDVFDTTGQRIRQVALPKDRTLVGVGPSAIYAVAYNEFDVQILERYGF